MLRQLRFEWRKNMSASWLFSLEHDPFHCFCSEEIADVGISLTSGYFWVGRKGSCASHGRLQCGDRWERSTALLGKRLEVGCEWMGWQHLVISTWGFQVWWIQDLFPVLGLFRTSLKHDWSAVFNETHLWNEPPRHLLFGSLGTSFSWYRICCWQRSPSSLRAVQIDAEFCVGATHWVRFWDSEQPFLRPVLPWNNPRYIASIRLEGMHEQAWGVMLIGSWNDYFLVILFTIPCLIKTYFQHWYSSPWSRSKCEKLAHFPPPERSQRTCFAGYGRLTQENTRGWTVATDLLMHKSLIGHFLHVTGRVVCENALLRQRDVGK